MNTAVRQLDEHFMREALAEARKGIGRTRPNPPVGAVVVKNGIILGRGFHPAAGKPHAEIYALKQAGPAARGATLYVTLEPCSTEGRTPACTAAIIKAGITRVVYAVVDPNPRHSGRANPILEKAGIRVTSRIIEKDALDIIRPFASRMIQGRPFLTLKLACTLDGRIADFRGRSRWITGSLSRSGVQELRRGADAIMVGAGTLRADDPSLLPRPARGRNPYRVIVTGSGNLPLHSQVFNDEKRKMTLVASSRSLDSKSSRVFKARGVSVLDGVSRDGRVDLKKLMKRLAKMNIMHVVCEGGGVLAGELIRARLVDEIWIYYGSKLLGSAAAPLFVGSWPLSAAPGFNITRVEKLGHDVLLVGTPSPRKRG